MTSVYEICLSKDLYRRIPEGDRALLFLSGHALNQITVIRKVVMFSLNHHPSDEVESMMCAGQSQVLYRMLLGLIEETWQMLGKHGITIKAYLSLLDSEAAEAHTALRKHFGNSNLLSKIRNTLIFHYPSADQVNEAFDRVDPDDTWSIYPSNSYSNSFYLTSDIIVASAILNVTGEKDTAAAWQKVLDAMVPVSNDLLTFLTSLMRAIYDRHLGEDVLSGAGIGGIHELVIDSAPKFSEVSFPFFALDE